MTWDKPLNTVITGETGRMGRVKDKWLKDGEQIIYDYKKNKMSRSVALANLRNIGVDQERANEALDEVDAEHVCNETTRKVADVLLEYEEQLITYQEASEKLAILGVPADKRSEWLNEVDTK